MDKRGDLSHLGAPGRLLLPRWGMQTVWYSLMRMSTCISSGSNRPSAWCTGHAVVMVRVWFRRWTCQDKLKKELPSVAKAWQFQIILETSKKTDRAQRSAYRFCHHHLATPKTCNCEPASIQLMLRAFVDVGWRRLIWVNDNSLFLCWLLCSCFGLKHFLRPDSVEAVKSMTFVLLYAESSQVESMLSLAVYLLL